MKIHYKLFFAILATAFVSVFAIQQAQRYSFEQGLQRYSQSSRLERLQPLILGLIDIYEQEGDWSSLKGKKRLPIPPILVRSDQRFNESARRHERKDSHMRPRRPPRLFAELALLDDQKQHVAGLIALHDRMLKPIELQDAVIGYLAIPSNASATREIDRRFSEQQRTGRLWAVAVILIGALFSAILISRSLARPINHLVEQVQKLSDGHYGVTVLGEKSVEFGSLSRNLSRLAAKLRENRINRQQWISDISHELRTPVAILKAEIECIEDGHKPFDKEALQSLGSEVNRLSYLIGDLHQLAQADSGAMSFNFSLFDLKSEIELALATAAERFVQKKISVDIKLADFPLIYGDIFRLRQVVNNVLENTVRYTESPGHLRVSWCQSDQAVELVFEDSAPSVPQASLPKLFERLYRVDPSRSRATGASGLGLSICHSIIKAHGGDMTAEQSSLGGLSIRFTLPTQVL